MSSEGDLRDAQSGFTLIEMAVVLTIIAVLAAVMTPMVLGYVDQARVVRAAADVSTIADAIRFYQRDTGKFPIYGDMTNANNDVAAGNFLVGPGTAPTATTFGALGSVSLLSQMSVTLGLSTGTQVGSNLSRVAFRGPYVAALEPDPWSHQIVVTAQNLRRASTNWGYVVSAGPDGKIDTALNQAKTATFVVAGDDIVSVVN